MRYVINYKAFDGKGNVIKEGAVKATAPDEIAAKFNLPSYLQNKYPDIYRIDVLSCKQDNDIFNYLKDIFGI